MRRMTVACGGGASEQHVKDLLAGAVAWLGIMSLTHVLAVLQLHGEAQPSGAELRMQLSATATMLKYGGLAITAARPFAFPIMMSIQEPPREAASAWGSIPHQLHFVSLYIAALQNQPGGDWGLYSPSFGGFLHDPSLIPFTEDSRDLADSVLSLHQIIQARLFYLTNTADLGPHALAVMTTGPVWGMFAAAAGIGLHPYGRLHSSQDFDPEGYHTGTTRVISFIEQASAISSTLMAVAAARGEDASPEGLLTRGQRSSTLACVTEPSRGQSSSTLGDKVGAAAAASSMGCLSKEQRSIVLACVTSAHALLHSEALGCLVGQLWHIRVNPRLTTRDSSGSSQQPGGALGGRALSSSSSKEGYMVGQLVLKVFSDLRNVMGCAFGLASRSCPRIVEDEDSSPSSEAALGRKLRKISLVGLETEVAGSTPLSFFDVPTRVQSEVMGEGLRILSQMRSLATELLAMINSNPDPGDVGTSWSQWEVLQAALLRSLPPEQQEDWGRPLWCCNPGCTNLSGPSELQLKTYACGGGCGVRYCSRECQVQGWRLGHRHSCGEIVLGRG